jgi:hypothetical protein
MLAARTITVSIDRHWTLVYEAIWRPEFFPRWASGLSKSSLTKHREIWKAKGPEGAITIRFTDHNAFGVMDHYVDVGTGPEIYIPLRVIPNGDGAEVLFTLFRQPGMSDAKSAADAEWVERDLLSLSALVRRTVPKLS